MASHIRSQPSSRGFARTGSFRASKTFARQRHLALTTNDVRHYAPVGPGLSMCLRVGVVAAQNLCAEYAKPIVPVHHMEAHALVARLSGGTEKVTFPFLALLVSGGHNQLILARGIGDYTILGTTLVGRRGDRKQGIISDDVPGRWTAPGQLQHSAHTTAYAARMFAVCFCCLFVSRLFSPLFNVRRLAPLRCGRRAGRSV